MFSKKKRESAVRDASRRMKRYVKRCPLEELPTTKARIVSRFIRGLRSDLLKKDLYVKKCSTLDEVTKISIDLVDNCKIFEEDAIEIGNDRKSSTSSEASIAKPVKRTEAAVDYKQVTEEVLRRVNAAAIPKPKKCYICAGDHLSKECPHLPKGPKWCDVEKKWTNHSTKECYYNKGYVQERQMAPQAVVQPPPLRYTPGPTHYPTGVEK